MPFIFLSFEVLAGGTTEFLNDFFFLRRILSYSRSMRQGIEVRDCKEVF